MGTYSSIFKGAVRGTYSSIFKGAVRGTFELFLCFFMLQGSLQFRKHFCRKNCILLELLKPIPIPNAQPHSPFPLPIPSAHPQPLMPIRIPIPDAPCTSQTPPIPKAHPQSPSPILTPIPVLNAHPQSSYPFPNLIPDAHPNSQSPMPIPNPHPEFPRLAGLGGHGKFDGLLLSHGGVGERLSCGPAGGLQIRTTSICTGGGDGSRLSCA